MAELARTRPDLILVVGGFNSSNTGHLRRIAADFAPAFHIDGPDCLISASEIRHKPSSQTEPAIAREWLPAGPLSIGLTAGASTPNRVTGINVQVCWDKFANYWDVEMRLVPMEGDRYHLSPEEAVKLCDENTIGVVVVMGSTFDGSYEDVRRTSELLDDLEQRTGLDVPIHVDAASGGFVAPFLDPDLEWDFRVPRVQSINVSGHKYGLVYPGVGWAIWRDADALPDDLIFWVNYLGDEMPTFALNFSRPGAQVVAQYYNFLRLGVDGYRRVQQYSRDVARYVAGEILSLIHISEPTRPY